MADSVCSRGRAVARVGLACVSPRPRRIRTGPLCRSSTSSEKGSWPAGAPARAPSPAGRDDFRAGAARPPPPPRPPPWSAAFWLPGDPSLRGRRMALATLGVLGGSFALRKLLPAGEEPPRVYLDDSGQRYLVTEGGAQLALYEDDKGRPYFLDPKGNMWYDSGDPSVGIHRIAPDGDVFALWEDPKTGEVLERRVGNIDRDLVDVKTKEYGDLTLFKDAEEASDVPPLCRDDRGDLVKCLDPNGRIRADRDLEYPEVLLEGQIKNLERRRRVFGGRKRGEEGKGDRDIETFRQGDIGPLDLGLFD